ncbi:MAG: bifunctional folylpolyglutamate synthase/dihydrofolate synthase [Ignavibacteriales bacterium]|nr:bifunctional folylpolyglutamate synthase/dihydrofolate synthase [Ignavibacteriales bacterium]
MEIERALEKIFALHSFGVKLGLENINKLLNFLNNPQNNFKSIHIAGSNGKGSTASFIASILMEMGYKVGLYTSPHLVEFNERIRINGNKIPNEYVAKFISSVDSLIDEKQITFFEVTTALAFSYFSDEKIDYAVIETGLGGRLDATNTINPLSCVFTTISHEHTNILGEELWKIAEEKAGIIKKDSKVFFGILPEEAENVIREKIRYFGNEFYSLKENIDDYPDYVKLHLTKFNYNLYKTPLVGRHQLFNCSLAILVLDKIFDIKTDSAISQGIKNVIKNTGIQARYETYSENPKIIFDAAHNLEGVESFIAEFEKEYSRYKETNLIFSTLQDKNIFEMFKRLNPYFTKAYVTTLENERAYKIDEIYNICKEIRDDVQKLESPSDFIVQAKCSNGNKCIVILGSIYLLGQIKKELMNKDINL